MTSALICCDLVNQVLNYSVQLSKFYFNVYWSSLILCHCISPKVILRVLIGLHMLIGPVIYIYKSVTMTRYFSEYIYLLRKLSEIMSLLICLFLCIRLLKTIIGKEDKCLLEEMQTNLFWVCPMVAILIALMSAVTRMCMMTQCISEHTQAHSSLNIHKQTAL